MSVGCLPGMRALDAACINGSAETVYAVLKMGVPCGAMRLVIPAGFPFTPDGLPLPGSLRRILGWSAEFSRWTMRALPVR